jgi:hypothetical protein
MGLPARSRAKPPYPALLALPSLSATTSLRALVTARPAWMLPVAEITGANQLIVRDTTGYLGAWQGTPTDTNANPYWLTQAPNGYWPYEFQTNGPSGSAAAYYP